MITKTVTKSKRPKTVSRLGDSTDGESACRVIEISMRAKTSCTKKKKLCNLWIWDIINNQNENRQFSSLLLTFDFSLIEFLNCSVVWLLVHTWSISIYQPMGRIFFFEKMQKSISNDVKKIRKIKSMKKMNSDRAWKTAGGRGQLEGHLAIPSYHTCGH